jgi:hypothetical protein
MKHMLSLMIVSLSNQWRSWTENGEGAHQPNPQRLVKKFWVAAVFFWARSVGLVLILS